MLSATVSSRCSVSRCSRMGTRARGRSQRRPGCRKFISRYSAPKNQVSAWSTSLPPLVYSKGRITMAAKQPSLDKAATMKHRARQTVTPPVTKTVGEPRSPRPVLSSTGNPEQSTGHRRAAPQPTGNPHNKGGRRRSLTPHEVLVMDGACFVGIDVAKDTLDGCLRPGGTFQHENTPAGIAKVVALLGSQAITLVVVEATGGLEVPLVRALQ